MLTLSERLKAFAHLGIYLDKTLKEPDHFQNDFDSVIQKSEKMNPWFTKENQIMALNAIAQMLKPDVLQHWTEKYLMNDKTGSVGLIMAGNIPAVGFHDLLTVLIAGRKAIVKPSSSDTVLIEFLAAKLVAFEPQLKDYIEFVDKLQKPEVVIATGSDNSAMYFEHYFKNIPHIIRRNRNSVAILSGDETKEELSLLGKDVFSYFGLGCRNVSKLMVPEGYDFKNFFEAIQQYGDTLMQHTKYMNNYDYYRAIFLMEQKPFLTNNFLHLVEDAKIASPVSTLHYQYYHSPDDLRQSLTFNLEKIQCIVSHKPLLGDEVAFGQSQYPAVTDYADGVDTLEFLLSV